MAKIKYRIWNHKMKQFLHFKIDAKNAQRYTGLKDKNGNEIYEGDILKNESWKWNGEVFWDSSYFQGWAIKTGEPDIVSFGGFGEIEQNAHVLVGKDKQYTDECSVLDCVVIGNMTENPELVQAENFIEKDLTDEPQSKD